MRKLIKVTFYSFPQVQSVFGLRGRRVNIFSDTDFKQNISSAENILSLTSKTLYVTPVTGPSPDKPINKGVTSSVCHFVNVKQEAQKREATLLLENPRGDNFSLQQLQAQV